MLGVLDRCSAMNSGLNIGWQALIHISPLGHSTFKTEGGGVENGVHDMVAARGRIG